MSERKLIVNVDRGVALSVDGDKSTPYVATIRGRFGPFNLVGFMPIKQAKQDFRDEHLDELYSNSQVIEIDLIDCKCPQCMMRALLDQLEQNLTV